MPRSWSRSAGAGWKRRPEAGWSTSAPRLCRRRRCAATSRIPSVPRRFRWPWPGRWRSGVSTPRAPSTYRWRPPKARWCAPTNGGWWRSPEPAARRSAPLDLDANRVSPIFVLRPPSAEAHDFSRRLASRLSTRCDQRAAAEVDHRPRAGSCDLDLPAGGPQGDRRLLLFATADAQGMNMIVKASDEPPVRFIHEEHRRRAPPGTTCSAATTRRSGPAAALLRRRQGQEGGGRRPHSPERSSRAVSPQRLRKRLVGPVAAHGPGSPDQAGSLGYNGHFANGLTALFIACGQDVANVANAAVGITHFEVTRGREISTPASPCPALTVATVGGGTHLGTARECLEMVGCSGARESAPQAGGDLRRRPPRRRALHGRRHRQR